MNKLENWTSVISADRPFWSFPIKEVWKYKDLILLLVRRDLISQYKQTILGPLWLIIQPVLTTIMFTFLFFKIARLSTDGIPPILFYMSGILLWTFFSTCLTQTSNTFHQNSNLFGKVYFPRLCVPISIVMTQIVTLSFQLIIFVCIGIYYLIKGYQFIGDLSHFLLIPLIFLQVGVLSLGMGAMISSLTTKYRDLNFVLGFFVQMWMYATPVVYPLSSLPENLRWVFYLNPMAGIIENFRIIIFGKGTVTLELLTLGIAETILVFIIGVWAFSRVERNFIDTI